jgi:hypothetical protein
MVRTDVEEMTCEFQILRSRFAGLEDLLNELAEKNDKFSDWSRLED